MNKLLNENTTKEKFEIVEKLVLDEITSEDDLEELIYTIIDACPYDFQAIPTIASFKYLSGFDKITQYSGVRYFYKMYKLIDILCIYKDLIEKVENQVFSENKTTNSSKTNIAIICDEEDLFKSCQIDAINIYKSSFIDDEKLAFCLNCIINEFFEEAFTSKLSKKDMNREVKLKSVLEGMDIYEFGY